MKRRILVIVCTVSVILILGGLLVWQAHRSGDVNAISGDARDTQHAADVQEESQAAAMTPAGSGVDSNGGETGVPADDDGVVESDISMPVDEDLPEAVSDEHTQMIVILAQRDKIYRVQDQAMLDWPAYADARDELLEELKATMRLEELSRDELLQAGRRLRGEYWAIGGSSSKTAYKSIYKSWAILEHACASNPNDLTLSDELAQTIMSAEVFSVFEKDSNKLIPNFLAGQIMRELRQKQFDLSRQQIDEGRKPTEDDFIRAFDLAVLQAKGKPEAAKEIVEWLQDNATIGGWSGYNEMLAMFHNNLDQDKPFVTNIYIPKKTDFPSDFRYGRRLPSFKWPLPDERRPILWGIHPEEFEGTITLKEFEDPR